MYKQSPLRNAGQLQRPVLLLAAGEDERVALHPVMAYAAKLNRLHKNVGLLVDDDAGHTNRRPLAKELNLYLVAARFERTLDGGRTTPPDAWLQR